MVTINEFKQIECDLYDPNGNLIGTIKNEYSFNDVRIQIMKQRLEGYYVVFNDYRIDIDVDGRLDSFPEGFYDILENQYDELLRGMSLPKK